MTIRTLETAILAEAREVLCNRKLRLRDIEEWTTGYADPQEAEISVYLPKLQIGIAIKEIHDKRLSEKGCADISRPKTSYQK
jgi:hypothetical protein